MRFLIVDGRYPGSIDEWYENHVGLADAPYEVQAASFRSSLIGETHAQAAALRELGHEANDVVFNLLPAQVAWAREHAVPIDTGRRVGLRLRRGVIPWPVRYADTRWIGALLLRQIETYKPDVVHVSAMNMLEPLLVREIRRRCRIMVGQIASLVPTDRALQGYDLVVSSLPNFVGRFRHAGADAEWLPLAFDLSALAAVGPCERTVTVSFVGSIFDVHCGRATVIEALAEQTPIDVWSADTAQLDGTAGARIRRHPAVWGADMYRVLASSKQTVNVHGRTEDGPPIDANNMRLFEATGMGSLLVTDRLRTLPDLFEIGREVVDYGSPEECAEIVAYYADHPEEAAMIAKAGQARTLRDHTWRRRMEREVKMIEQRL